MTFIYSKLLEDQLLNVDYKLVSHVYKVCMPKYMTLDNPHLVFSMFCQTDDKITAEKEMDAQMKANEDLLSFAKYPYYYCHVKDNIRYWRHLMSSPSEKVLLNIFQDKLLILV